MVTIDEPRTLKMPSPAGSNAGKLTRNASAQARARHHLGANCLVSRSGAASEATPEATRPTPATRLNPSATLPTLS